LIDPLDYDGRAEHLDELTEALENKIKNPANAF